MANIAICEHIKDNGDTCGSPALTGYSFCYFHQRLRQPRHRPGDFEYKLPILDTPESILMATQHITQAALDGNIEERRARLILSALRLAMTALKAMNKNDVERRNLGGEVLDAARPRAAFANVSVEATDDVKTKTNVGTGINVGTGRVNVGTGAPARPARAQLAVPAAAAAPEGSPWRKPWESVTTISPAPATATDKKPPLSATQLKLMKKILRRGPSDPRFSTAARLLDHSIAGAL